MHRWISVWALCAVPPNGECSHILILQAVLCSRRGLSSLGPRGSAALGPSCFGPKSSTWVIRFVLFSSARVVFPKLLTPSSSSSSSSSSPSSFLENTVARASGRALAAEPPCVFLHRCVLPSPMSKLVQMDPGQQTLHFPLGAWLGNRVVLYAVTQHTLYLGSPFAAGWNRPSRR